MATQIKLRRDTAANWTSANPTLALGEPGLETDTGNVKYGDGTTDWANLTYSGGGGGGSGTVTSITAGENLTGGTITDSGTIGMANSLANVNTISAESGFNMVLIPGNKLTLNSNNGADIELLAAANTHIYANGDSGNIRLAVSEGTVDIQNGTGLTVSGYSNLNGGFASFQDSYVNQKFQAKSLGFVSVYTATLNGTVNLNFNDGGLQYVTLTEAGGGDLTLDTITNMNNGDCMRVVVINPASNDRVFNVGNANIQTPNGGNLSFFGGSQAEDRYAVVDFQHVGNVTLVASHNGPLY